MFKHVQGVCFPKIRVGFKPKDLRAPLLSAPCLFSELTHFRAFLRKTQTDPWRFRMSLASKCMVDLNIFEQNEHCQTDKKEQLSSKRSSCIKRDQLMSLRRSQMCSQQCKRPMLKYLGMHGNSDFNNWSQVDSWPSETKCCHHLIFSMSLWRLSKKVWNS